MSVGREVKDATATEPFGFDWTNDLPEDDTISSSSWAFETAEGLTTTALTEVASSNTTTTTSILVSGGVRRATYYLVNSVVTAGGATLVRRMLLDVERE